MKLLEPLLTLSLFLAAAASAEDAPPQPADAAAQEEAPPLDPAQYPLMSLAQALSEAPCSPKMKSEIKDLTFSAELRYQGGLRDTSAPRYELLKLWTRQVGDPEAVVRYKKEISFSAGKRVFWLPVPEGLIDYLRSDLEVGDRALLYLVFAGCSAQKPVFAIDEFESYTPEDQEAEDYITHKPTGLAPML